MEEYIREMAELGFRSVELEGIGGEHLTQVYEKRFSIGNVLEEYDLKVPVFCTVLPGLTSGEKSVVRHTMELFRKGCETACYLDAKGVLDNGPLLPYLFPEDMEIHRHYTPGVLRYAHIPDGLV
ncbi:MAG: hypothetical protein LUD15_14230 [Bacteroides sp.]|nr:hypothetical protein [Bacteroides sp.]